MKRRPTISAWHDPEASTYFTHTSADAGLPHIQIPPRINKRAEPQSVAHASEERRELVTLQHRIQMQLREYGRNVGDFHPWRTDAKAKMNIVVQRIRFLKSWIKTRNMAASLLQTEAACGGDLDDPVVLVAQLRRIVLELKAAGQVRLPDEDIAVVNAATSYVHMMAHEDVESGEHRK